jgi:hypothetical protein
MALPVGPPALFAGANQACSLSPSGDDRERFENERDFLRSHSFPLLTRSLRVRRFLADPQALLPLSLPDARWPTGPGAERPAGVTPCKGASFVRPLRGNFICWVRLNW